MSVFSVQSFSALSLKLLSIQSESLSKMSMKLLSNLSVYYLRDSVFYYHMSEALSIQSESLSIL